MAARHGAHPPERYVENALARPQGDTVVRLVREAGALQIVGRALTRPLNADRPLMDCTEGDFGHD